LLACAEVRIDSVSYKSLAGVGAAAPQFQLTNVVDKFRFYQFANDW
jgi:hypothetical protein